MRSSSKKSGSGRILVGGLVEGVNFPRGKKTPIIDVDGCSNIILVSADYFLQNKGFIESWAMKNSKITS